MTAVHERPLDERPYLSAAAFGEIARIAERDDIRLEFINGRMWEKPVPDGDHDEIIMWLLEHCLQSRVDLRLSGAGPADPLLPRRPRPSRRHPL